MNSFGPYPLAQLVLAARSLYEPARLLPGPEGRIRLQQLSTQRLALLESFGSESIRVELVDRNPGINEVWIPTGALETWELTDVFDPFDFLQLREVAAGRGIPIRPHQDTEEQLARIRAALSAIQPPSSAAAPHQTAESAR